VRQIEIDPLEVMDANPTQGNPPVARHDVEVSQATVLRWAQTFILAGFDGKVNHQQRNENHKGHGEHKGGRGQNHDADEKHKQGGGHSHAGNDEESTTKGTKSTKGERG
jgi:hypothetical protein